jgi:hypothetical protein
LPPWDFAPADIGQPAAIFHSRDDSMVAISTAAGWRR